MKKIRYQAFISSTYEDLKEERTEVAFAVLENGCFPAGMELFAASDKTQWDVIKGVIDESDFYILIVAGRYGSTECEEYIDEDGKTRKKEISYTEKEFDYALAKNKPIIAFIHEDYKSLPYKKCEKSQKKMHLLENFQRKAMSGRIIKKWKDKSDLKASAITAITKLISDEDNKLKGWIPYEQAIDEAKETSAKEKFEMMEKVLKDAQLAEEKAIKREKEAEIEINKNRARIWELKFEYEDLLSVTREYNSVMESFLLECSSDPSKLTGYPKILSQFEEEREKRELSRLIGSHEMTYIIENGYISVNQDEPFPSHSVPEAREYALSMLSPENQKKAHYYGLL